jgi:hypothetical protein
MSAISIGKSPSPFARCSKMRNGCGLTRAKARFCPLIVANLEAVLAKLLEIANALEADHAGRLSVGAINHAFLEAGGNVGEYGAAMHRAVVAPCSVWCQLATLDAARNERGRQLGRPLH